MLTNSATGYEVNIARRRVNTLLHGHYGAMAAPRLKHPEDSPERAADGFPANIANATCPVWLIEVSDDQRLPPSTKPAPPVTTRPDPPRPPPLGRESSVSQRKVRVVIK
jgi:hypothetical protein